MEGLSPRHLPSFFSLAAREGWICEEWEFDFLLRAFPQGCRVALHQGSPAAFVTSVRYGKSGWIGNLLVREEFRGGGLGRRLMREAIASLREAGAGTVWLTASPSGLPLYEKLGFVAVDRIVRWRGKCGGGDRREGDPWCLEALEEVDRTGWGDSRTAIVREVGERGTVLGCGDGFCMLQRGARGWQLGPWGALRPEGAAALLEKAVAAGGDGEEIVLDAPEGNREGGAILTARGFAPCGATVLMYLGSPPAYRPGYIYALASLGSLG